MNRIIRECDGMKYFSTLIKPASSLCNLKCKYCFYTDVGEHRKKFSYGIMSDEVAHSIIDCIFDYFKEETTITFSFQGGEPTLAKIDFFKKFIDYVNKKKQSYHIIQYAIQTNGTLLNEEWYKLFLDNHFLVGISLDGFKENHDDLRKNIDQSDTFTIISKNIQEMKKRKIEFNILTVLTSQLSTQAKRLFEFYKENDLRYIQLIPCLPDFDCKQMNYGLSPKEFYHFYDEFFECWFSELKKGNYISVNYFDNLILLLKGIPPIQCGMLGFCNMQFVIESDGSVYPCDFYCLDQYKVGNVLNDGIKELIRSPNLFQFLHEKKRMSDLCEVCRFKKICNGNCKRMNLCYFDEHYCALQEFMTKHEKDLIRIAGSL